MPVPISSTSITEQISAVERAAKRMTTPCPRCGEPVKGTGKTGLCQVCAVHFERMKDRSMDAMQDGARARGKLRQRLRSCRKPAPVTLATKA